MKKTVAIAFFFIYLAASFHLEQLAKIPILFQHYREHIRMEGNISFVAFLKEHYVHDHRSDPDYARDQQLPFKTSHHFFMMMAPAMPRSAIEYISMMTGNRSCYISPLNDADTVSFFTDRIFQPPRIS